MSLPRDQISLRDPTSANTYRKHSKANSLVILAFIRSTSWSGGMVMNELRSFGSLQSNSSNLGVLSFFFSPNIRTGTQKVYVILVQLRLAHLLYRGLIFAEQLWNWNPPRTAHLLQSLTEVLISKLTQTLRAKIIIR